MSLRMVAVLAVVMVSIAAHAEQKVPLVNERGPASIDPKIVVPMDASIDPKIVVNPMRGSLPNVAVDLKDLGKSQRWFSIPDSVYRVPKEELRKIQPKLDSLLRYRLRDLEPYKLQIPHEVPESDDEDPLPKQR